MDENDSKIVRITVGIPQHVADRLDTYAKEHRWSRSNAAAALIEDNLPTPQAAGRKRTSDK